MGVRAVDTMTASVMSVSLKASLSRRLPFCSPADNEAAFPASLPKEGLAGKSLPNRLPSRLLSHFATRLNRPAKPRHNRGWDGSEKGFCHDRFALHASRALWRHAALVVRSRRRIGGADLPFC